MAKKNVSDGGDAIKIEKNRLVVPNNPIIPFIRGDGTGSDIWSASVRVFDAAVSKAYKNKKRIVWKEIFAGEHAFKECGEWLPKDTLNAIKNTRWLSKGHLQRR